MVQMSKIQPTQYNTNGPINEQYYEEDIEIHLNKLSI